jgi:hypothetical protein
VTIGSVLAHDDLRLAMVVILLVIVLVKEYFSDIWYYRPAFLAWLGSCFLIANWLVLNQGGKSEPVFVSFGPGFVIISAIEAIKHPWIRKQESNSAAKV